MKDFAKKIVASTCAMFTIFMTVGTIAALAFTGPQYGLVMTLTLLLASAAFALLRGVWFTDKVVRHMTYPVRILGFGVTAFFALAACAWAGSWFPADNRWAWLTFTIIYLVILAAFCGAYQIYFRKTSGSFDAALRQYHERMGR